MVVFIIVIAIVIEIELIIYFMSLKRNQRREKLTLQSLHKLMEVRVLNRTLQNRVSTEVATQQECMQKFVRLEFLDSKPWLAYLYAVDECITIGRNRENKVYIREEKLSRMHCKIMEFNNTLYLQDMGATNGTKVKKGLFSKVVLQPQGAVTLNSGDIIYLGHYRMRVKVYYGRQIYE